jgi:hypothetical protein
MKMPLVKQQQLFTRLVAKLLQWAFDQGYEITLAEAWRPPELQQLYIDQGKSWTKTSRHLSRRAIDLNLFVNGKYQTEPDAYAPLGQFWKSLHPGCKWGGDWKQKDAVHFEFVGP